MIRVIRPACRVLQLQKLEPMGTIMVLFDLNKTQGTAGPGSAACDYPARAFPREVPVRVKSVQRLSSQAWPFCVNSCAAPAVADAGRQSHVASSFVT